MWIEPYTYRGRHRPNYGTQNESRYFVPKIDCTNTVSMIFKATIIAMIVTVSGLLSVATTRTSLRGVCLGYELDFESCKFCLVAYHELETGKRPLVNLLVRYFSKLRSLTDAFEFAHHYRICLRLDAVRYKSTRDFVFSVLELSVQLG